jgi:phosphate uptake regulator
LQITFSMLVWRYMEIRKLQRTGGASLSMTVPKKWSDRFKLGDKDEVNIYFQKSGLLLVQPFRVKNETISTILQIDSLNEEMITRELVAHYISGSDQVVIKGKNINKNQRYHIRKVCQKLLGYEIIEESSREISIKNIFDVVKFPVPQNVERMFNITTSMFSDAIKSLVNDDQSLSSDVAERDFEINKLRMAIKRQFHKLLQDKMFDEEVDMNSMQFKYYETMSRYLERIADHAVKIAKTVLVSDHKLEDKVSSRLALVARKAISLLIDAKEMVKNIDKNSAHQILDKTLVLENALSSSKGATSPCEAVILDSLYLLAKRITDIAETVIDHAIIKEMN